MAVVGIEQFAKFFEGYEDCYTIIGGAACKHVNSKDLRKHKNDVFQLFQIVPDDETIDVRGDVATTIDRFINEMKDETIVFRDLGIDSDMDTELNAMRNVYKKVAEII